MDEVAPVTGEGHNLCPAEEKKGVTKVRRLACFANSAPDSGSKASAENLQPKNLFFSFFFYIQRTASANITRTNIPRTRITRGRTKIITRVSKTFTI